MLNISRTFHTSYHPLLTYLNLESLEQRRIRLDLYFIFKLLNGHINCPNLISRLSFKVSPAHTRSTNLFYLKSQTTNYATNTPLLKIMNSVNNYNIDPFFSTSFYSYKNHVSTKLTVHIT
jgi:hypothetical protein